jgi:hypothetical protein
LSICYESSLTDIDTPNENLTTPLAQTSRNGQHNVSRLLIERGADVDKRNMNQRTSLYWVSGCVQLEIMQSMVKYGSNTNFQDVMGCTPLHVVAQNRRLLLERGADVSAQNLDDMTSLDLASNNGNVGMARFLAERMVYVDTMDRTDVTVASVDHRLQKRRSDIMQLGIIRLMILVTRWQRRDAAHPILSLLDIASREGLHAQGR